MARALAGTLQDLFETTVTVDNRVGGSGAVATAYLVTRAAPDGSVLQLVTPTQLITPLRAGGIPSFEDVTPVARLLLDPTILYVRRDSPFRTAEEMFQSAMESPGSLTWGVGSAGSLDQLLIDEIRTSTGIDVRMVPHEGGGDAMLSVLGGHIDAGLGEPGQFLAQLETGAIRVLTIFEEDRSPRFPEVPTFRELGYPVESLKFRGVWGPPGMPEELSQIIGKTLRDAMEEEPFRSYYRAGSMRPAYLGTREFTEFLVGARERVEQTMGQTP